MSDSRYDTVKHIQKVRQLGMLLEYEFQDRLLNHDKSKLEEPEKSIFDEYSEKLGKTEYGSDEYKKNLAEMEVALYHHYANNRHHPEHFKDGIKGMNLIDILEMFVDWRASSLRMKETSLDDFIKSIVLNQKRFNMSDDLTQILINTAEEYFK